MTDDGNSATAPPAVRRRARRLALAAAAGLSAGFVAALLSGSAAQADPSSTPNRTLVRVASSAHHLVRTVLPTDHRLSSPRPPKASPALDGPTVSAPTDHSGRGTSPTGTSRVGGHRGTDTGNGTGTAPSGRTGRRPAAPAAARPASAQPTTAQLTTAQPRSARHASAQLGVVAAVARSAAGDAATVVQLIGSGVSPLSGTLPVLGPVAEHPVDVVRPLVDNPPGGPLIDTMRGVLGTVFGSSAGTYRPPVPVPPVPVASLIVPTTTPHGSGAARPTTDTGAVGTIPATTQTVRLILRPTTDAAATGLAERLPSPSDVAPPQRREPTSASPGRNCPLAPPIPAYGAGTDARTALAVSPVNRPLDQLTLACPVRAQRPAAPLDAAYAPATRPG